MFEQMMQDVASMTDDELALCLEEEVNWMLDHRPQEPAHIMIYAEAARRLRNGIR